jgi:hypothetical protein
MSRLHFYVGATSLCRDSIYLHFGVANTPEAELRRETVASRPSTNWHWPPERQVRIFIIASCSAILWRIGWENPISHSILDASSNGSRNSSPWDMAVAFNPADISIGRPAVMPPGDLQLRGQTFLVRIRNLVPFIHPGRRR